MATKIPESINEHVDRLKYLFKYTINEANYTLVDNIEEDDTIPDDIFSDNSVTPIPVKEDDEPQMDNEGLPVDDASEEELPIDTGIEEPIGEPGIDVNMEEPLGEPEQPSVDQIQNDIIKSSVSAMQKMNDELKNLESTLGNLNSKIDGLSQDVEEVREPTNVEKLMSKKEDSHPYYYNLNDMWDGNSFQARRQVEDSEGMKKMEDGSFVADFDTLPKYTDQEVSDSFNESKSIKKKKINEDVNGDIYFDTLSGVLDYTRKYAQNLGFELDDEEVWQQLGTGGISYGDTKSVNIPLLKDGKPILDKRGNVANRSVRVSIYRMDSGKYELTIYKTW